MARERYCTPAMLSALTDAKKGTKCPPPMYWLLRARGWIDVFGMITSKGLEYLTQRSVS